MSMSSLRPVFVFFSLLFSSLLFGGSVVFYSGSFDPPTQAHFEIMKQVLNMEGTEKLYVSVNRISGEKDFDASIVERMNYVRVFTDRYPDKVELVAEAFEGKDRFAQSLALCNAGKTFITVLGEDSFRALPATSRDCVRRWLVVPREVDDMPGNQGSPLRGDETIEFFKFSAAMDQVLKGVSSSLVRKYIKGGESEKAAQLLDPELAKVLLDQSVYKAQPVAQLEEARRNFDLAFRAFKNEVRGEMAKGTLPAIDLERMAGPAFKETQTEEAQKDKFVRWLSKAAKLKEEATRFLYLKFSSLRFNHLFLDRDPT